MSITGWLVVYSLAVLVASLLGGYVPFVGQVRHSRLQFYLSGSAGVMLGASFFHLMPDAMKLAGDAFGWWMSLGVVGLFCIERFIAPHSHEIDVENGHSHPHKHEHEHGHDAHNHGHVHEHEHGHAPARPHEPRAAAPAVAGWMAVLGLTIHTFMNGVGLAGAVKADRAVAALPGLAIFVAIVLHKPADALAISTVLTRKGVSRRLITWVQIGFGLTVAVGAAAFCLAEKAMDQAMKNQLIGAALAFSCGTFLFVALSDLLPEVQFHRHDRVPLFLTLAAGVALMGFIALLEEHDEGNGHNHGQPAQHDHGEKAGPEKKGAKAAHEDDDHHNHEKGEKHKD